MFDQEAAAIVAYEMFYDEHSPFKGFSHGGFVRGCHAPPSSSAHEI